MAGPQQLSDILNAARPVAIAALLRYFSNLEDAEDAVQEACLRALRNWPRDGLPRNPEAWLILVARNIGIDEKRKTNRFTSYTDTDLSFSDDTSEDQILHTVENHPYRDDILRLLFLCCHPSLSFEQQVALCLKIIAGLTVEDIAAAFLVKPATMAQRITRAKQKISSLALFDAPPTEKERGDRVHQVRTAVYLLFNEGYAASHGEDHIKYLECREAIRLARFLLQMAPAEPETMGLLSLCLLQNSRQKARLSPSGHIILLEDQDRMLWDQKQITEAVLILEKALRLHRPGPLQIQASIAAVHAQAATADKTNWAEITELYTILSRMAPSPVITLNLAASIFKSGNITDAYSLISPLSDALGTYQYFHGLKAEICLALGKTTDAKAAFSRALELAQTPASAIHIRARLDKLQK